MPLIIFGCLLGAKRGGAPIPTLFLVLLAIPLFLTPGSSIVGILLHHLGRLLEQAFIYLFA